MAVRQRPNLNVQTRDKSGSNACLKMRLNTNNVPGVLYGKGETPALLAADQKELRAIIQQGHRMVNLKTSGVAKEQPALFKEVQWDTYSDRIVHFDLARVALTDRIKISVNLEFVGEDGCPGVKGGGVVDHIRNAIDVEAPVIAIPESVRVDLSKLALNELVTAGKLPLPEGVKLVTDANINVAVCHLPKVEAAPVAAAVAGEPGAVREPEIIKPERAAKEDEEGEKDKKEKK